MADNKKKILLLDILTGNPKTRREVEGRLYGGKPYMTNIVRALGIGKGAYAIVDASRAQFPSPRDFYILIIGGSAGNPVRGTEGDWMKKTYCFIREAERAQVPILGICGGMQFTVRALGGRIALNPRGLHFGAVDISLTREGVRDPLFQGLPKKFLAYCNHACIVPATRPGWKVLASSDAARIEALAIGPRVRLVEFHPEKNAAEMRTIARMNNISPPPRAIGPLGGNIMKNFMEYCRHIGP